MNTKSRSESYDDFLRQIWHRGNMEEVNNEEKKMEEVNNEEKKAELKLSEIVFERAVKEISRNQDIRIEALKIAAQIVVGLFRDKKYRNIDDVVDEMEAIYKISDINLKYIKGDLDE